ncbi:MAG: hypothetical protein MPK62_00725 [Alphaproteobacteria bacterium]|nr:hypothetical protein [Alphaproteobacteria bacterium]MDA8029662.1 hypothetical protein [Alphaproteobacteria bacterium]
MDERGDIREIIKESYKRAKSVYIRYDRKWYVITMVVPYYPAERPPATMPEGTFLQNVDRLQRGGWRIRIEVPRNGDDDP